MSFAYVMGKKPQRHSWPEAKKVCRLNQLDIEMAKRLGFGPDALIRARPDPKQKWKLPVKYWIHELHAKRFGKVLGENPEVLAPAPAVREYNEEAARCLEEELYWEDYRDRNRDEIRSGKRAAAAPKAEQKPDKAIDPHRISESISDGDVPF